MLLAYAQVHSFLLRALPTKPMFGSGKPVIVDEVDQEIAAAFSQSIVNRFVSGERGISLETAAKIAAYLKLDLR